eukprot:TRINITY_DN6529_c0_g1_i2.p1 TRINITY_DN6529_c0_g1~~TRINITY_DN6529_c0_g1_i2.p1  ORF type:complete len:233 (-),score=28.53 TRINITY_DN6529_c0_g1_i2:179-877(-)
MTDTNQDQKFDSFVGQVTFYTTTTQLRNCKIFLFFDYGLRGTTKMQMQSFVMVDINSVSGISHAIIDGQILFQQKNPLISSSITRRDYNTSIFEDSNIVNFNLADLIQAMHARNESLKADYQTIVIPGNGGSNLVTIDIKLEIPVNQAVIYVPNILENLKFSWIQYLSLLIPSLYVVRHILRFAFRNRIFAAREKTNLPKTKMLQGRVLLHHVLFLFIKFFCTSKRFLWFWQ